MPTQQKYAHIIRSGIVKCYICAALVECKDIEKHINDKHSGADKMCFFCGSVTIVKQSSRNRYEGDVHKHLVECCQRMKIKPPKKQAVKRPRTNDVEEEMVENRPGYRRDVSSKDIQNDRGQVIGIIDSEIFVDENVLQERMIKRESCLDGDRNCKILAANVEVDGIDDIKSFWNTFNFAIPMWLSSMFADDRMFLNQLEFHPNANIDTFWAKVYGDERLEFYHVFVHMCVFDKFARLVRGLYDVCTLLRYACVCDKHRRHHVHFILVAKKESLIQLKINTKTIGGCSVTNKRESYTAKMATLGMKIIPSWPDHRHFHMKSINSAMHLFNTINYICNRSSNKTSVKESHMATTSGHGGGKYRFDNITTADQRQMAINVRSFIDSYTTDLDYSGSHLYIFRPIYLDAPLWFTATSRRGLLEYVEYCMNKRSVEDKVKYVIRKGTNSLHLKYRDIMEYLVQSVVPLMSGQYLHHSRCIDGSKRSIKDENRYIYLGKNEYVHVSKQDYPCCNEYSRELFFDSQPETLYMLNRRHRHEFALYQKWMAEKDEIIHQKDLENAVLKEQNKSLVEKFTMMQNENTLIKELRLKDNEIHAKDKIISQLKQAIVRLENKLSHVSSMMAKKYGPYLESNDKSQV